MKKTLILFCDDRQDMRQAFGDQLARWKGSGEIPKEVECHSEATVQWAKRSLKNNAYSLLITDMNFEETTPTMTTGKEGIELIKYALQVQPEIKCILITAFGDHLSGPEVEQIIKPNIKRIYKKVMETKDLADDFWNELLEWTRKFLGLVSHVRSLNIARLWFCSGISPLAHSMPQQKLTGIFPVGHDFWQLGYWRQRVDACFENTQQMLSVEAHGDDMAADMQNLLNKYRNPVLITIPCHKTKGEPEPCPPEVYLKLGTIIQAFDSLRDDYLPAKRFQKWLQEQSMRILDLNKLSNLGDRIPFPKYNQLETVWTIFVSNVNKHAPGALIRVSGEKDENEKKAKLIFANSGKAIGPEVPSSVQEPFATDPTKLGWIPGMFAPFGRFILQGVHGTKLWTYDVYAGEPVEEEPPIFPSYLQWPDESGHHRASGTAYILEIDFSAHPQTGS